MLANRALFVSKAFPTLYLSGVTPILASVRRVSKVRTAELPKTSSAIRILLLGVIVLLFKPNASIQWETSLRVVVVMLKNPRKNPWMATLLSFPFFVPRALSWIA